MRRTRIDPWLVSILMLCTAAASWAQTKTSGTDTPQIPDEVVVLGKRETHIRLVTVKDPILAAILSGGTPGMGQIYVGRWQRGLVFLGGVAASVVAMGLAGDNLSLTVADYDKPAYDGNGDGKVDVDEYRRWEKEPTKDFSELSTTRKAIVIGGLTTAVGLYIWSIVDANLIAKEHNRQLYRELSGMQLSFAVSPDGIPRGGLSFSF